MKWRTKVTRNEDDDDMVRFRQTLPTRRVEIHCNDRLTYSPDGIVADVAGC